MNTYISAIDYYLPNQIVKTRDMMAETKPERLGFADTMIEDKVGIFEVRHADNNEKPSTLATLAAKKALAKFEGNPDDIGMIIFCGIDRDYIEPSTAHIVQHNLGLKNAVCFDVTNACLGFMTGIQIATPAILANMTKHVLVCTGERSSDISKVFIPNLKNTDSSQQYSKQVGALTIGDAGVAAIISPSREQQRGILGLQVSSKGQLADLCHYKLQNGKPEGQMLMKEICNAGFRTHKNMLPKTLKAMGKTPDDINCVITHQVGKSPWERFSRLLGVKNELMTKTFDTLGNITSATFGVNYAKAIENDQVKEGDFLLAAMSGSGLTTCQIGIIV